MEEVLVGLSYEGDADATSIKVLLSKIFLIYGFVPKIIHDFPAHTGIIKFVPYHTRAFFEGSEKVNIAIYLTDQDKDPTNRKSIVKSKIETVNPVYLSKCAIGVPNPHFEQWLMKDTDTVKSIFRIPHRSLLPFSSMKPKLRLENLQRTMVRPKLSLSECYEKLASRFNIGLLKAIPEFSSFYNDINSILTRHRASL